MNPDPTSSMENTRDDAETSAKTRILFTLLTGACAVLFTLFAWVVLVMLLDRSLRAYEDVVWSATLWLSVMLCSGIVAYFRHSVRPVLACTIAFGVFGLTYMACGGPIFGIVSEGGDPSMTRFVVWNLTRLPLGVFAATENGTWLGHRNNHKDTAER